MSELVDTTEMYLKSIYELIEDGVTPMRARIVERLSHSGPTVSQTVARMERDGYVELENDRSISLTKKGIEASIGVIRKHRLAERLLVDVIGLQWEYAHEEACRWEHVMSHRVEALLIPLLKNPRDDPYGNPIPQVLSALRVEKITQGMSAEVFLHKNPQGGEAQIVRIGEPLQAVPGFLKEMRDAEMLPGSKVFLSCSDSLPGGDVRVILAGRGDVSPVEGVEIPEDFLKHFFVKL